MALAQEFRLLDRAQHDVRSLDCGKPAMNEFLSRHAAKHARQGLSTTYVLAEDTASAEARAPIAAYFTLASTTAQREDLPTSVSLPRYPVPVVLLARMAVDQRRQGQRLGEKTLVAALRKAAELTRLGLPAFGLVLDVLDEDALGFYQKFDFFQPFSGNPMRLFVPMQALRQV